MRRLTSPGIAAAPRARVARPTYKRSRAVLGAILAGAFAALPAAADEGGLDVLLDSAIVDAAGGTVTLPLFRARQGARDVYYIVTESSRRDDARARGVNFSPKLANALGSAAVQRGECVDGQLAALPGGVDFSPEHRLVPGPDVFPPAQAEPGASGDAAYSPLVTCGDGVVINAPQVANDTGVHDKVVAIDLRAMRVSLRLTEGRYHGKQILYLSTDASDPVAAALEEAVFAPNLNAAPGIASSDPKTSARSAIVPIVNGPTGADNPQRQGLVSALLGEGSPLNVTEIHPRNKGSIPEYSPLWDVHPAVWTEAAVASGARRRLEHHRDVARAFTDGQLLSGGAGPANPNLGGLRAAGFIVNCPVVTLR